MKIDISNCDELQTGNRAYAEQGRTDLAPEICRQRLVIEGTVEQSITDADIVSYLSELSEVCGMIPLMVPMTHRSDLYGWAGWIHWETSGAHFYAWDEPRKFFSVDIYTCKRFDPKDAVEHARSTFRPIAITSFGF